MNKKISTIDLLLIATTFVWGFNAPVLKIGLKYMNIDIYNFIRMTIGAIVCWIFFFLTKKQNRIEKKDLLRIILISIFGYFSMLYGFVKGLSYTTAGNAVLLVGLVPCFVAILNHFLKIEKITIKVLVGIILSFTGVLFIALGSGKGFDFSGSHIIGIGIVLLSQFGVAIYTVFIKDLMNKYTVYQIFPFLTSISAILFAIISYKQIPDILFSSIPLPGWTSIIYTGVLSACFGHFIWVWGVKKIGSVKTSLYNNLTPVFGVITGILILKEPFGLLQFVGAVVIFTGIYFTRTQKKIKQIFNIKGYNISK